MFTLSRKIANIVLLCGMTCGFSSISSSAEVTGAGSTFVYPVLAKWAESFRKATGHSINYQSIGSGGGIKQIQSKTVDFGATDKPLTKAELDKDGLVQFPIVNGSVVPVINVKGIKPGEIKLTGPVLADIYLGKIKAWNDPAIASLNAGIKLPSDAIAVVHRADGSGTTFIWSNYLSKVSPEWKTKVGEGTAISWPTGMAGKGNEGVASYVQKINGAIGYVEYAYAFQNKMNFTGMQNAAGRFVNADVISFSAAASSANWDQAEAFNLILTNAPGPDSWPIAGSTFILMQKNSMNPQQSQVALEFFRFAFSKEGADAAAKLHYVPLTNLFGIEWISWLSELLKGTRKRRLE